MVRLVCADMDGTFLASSGEPPADNVRALELLAERGVEFVPASGRPVTAVPRPAMESPATHYAITCNGARVCRLADGGAEVLRSSLMPAERVLALYERLRDREITFDVMLDGVAYAERFRYEHLERLIPDPVMCAGFRRMRTQVDVTVPELLEGRDEVEKVTMFWRDPADREAMVACAEADPALSWASSSARNVEVAAADASKGAALSWLAAHLGIDPGETVAFGDNLNDVSMLEAAGRGVAMGNASAEALAAADEVTASCDEAGVARWIERALA